MTTARTFVSFGEIMLRLSPPERGSILTATGYDACYGGTEANLLACLSAHGHPTRYVTALPNNALGDAAVRHLMAGGIDTSCVVRQGDTMGMYFYEAGFGARPAQVMYHRRHSAVTDLGIGSVDMDAVFADCTCFHISGISFALSESVRQLCFALLREAKQREIPVSFDCNYRSRLWSVEQAGEVYREILPFVDILFCAPIDLEAFFHTDAEHFYQQYRTPLLVVRQRNIVAEDRHTAGAAIYRAQGAETVCLASEEISFPVLERVGSGDAFAAGVLHGLWSCPDGYADALHYGMVCFSLKHTVAGDTLYLKPEAIQAHLNHEPKDVSR